MLSGSLTQQITSALAVCVCVCVGCIRRREEGGETQILQTDRQKLFKAKCFFLYL